MINRVLDTNVILDRPFADVIASFEPCIITIPIVVLKELDKFKLSDNEILRFNTREASRYIDRLRKLGDLAVGVEVESGHIIRIELNYADVAFPVDLNIDPTNDYRIIKVALGLKNDGEDVVLVSQDTLVRVVADTVGVVSEDYGRECCGQDGTYNGWRSISLSETDIDTLFKKKRLYLNIEALTGTGDLAGIVENEYVMFSNISNPKNMGVAKFDGECLVPFDNSQMASGIKPLNLQQRFLMDLLLDPNIKVVTSIGGAGSGKTLLAVASALEQIKGIGDSGKNGYSKLMVTRSAIGADHDIGFLPGSEFEKMSAWLASVTDALEYVYRNALDPQDLIEDYIARHKIEYKAMTFMRGRSLNNQVIIVEEAQNLTKQAIKLLLTRVSQGAKMIIIGDIEQIDNTRLSESHNGLVYLVNAFKGLPFYGHVTMPKVERSEVAEAAVNLL